MDGNGHILTRTNLETDGVRYGRPLGRHRHPGLAAEGQTHGRGLINLRTTAGRLGQCQFHGLDFRSTRAELVGQFQAHFLTAN